MTPEQKTKVVSELLDKVHDQSDDVVEIIASVLDISVGLIYSTVCVTSSISGIDEKVVAFETSKDVMKKLIEMSNLRTAPSPSKSTH